jgi:xanthine dehydrogenase/oxidase
MEKKPDATMQEIEDVLDGNLCRCTGYRPIFDAFKSMASDASADLISKVENYFLLL